MCITIRLLNLNIGEIFVHTAGATTVELRKEFVPRSVL